VGSVVVIFLYQMSVYSDQDSILTTSSSTAQSQKSFTPTPETKDLKTKIKSIKTPEKMIEYSLENAELLSEIPTALLNVWNPIEGYKYYRRHNTVKFGKSDTTTYSKNKLVATRLDELEAKISEFEHVLEQLTAGVKRQKHLPEIGDY
jgi:protease II